MTCPNFFMLFNLGTLFASIKPWNFFMLSNLPVLLNSFWKMHHKLLSTSKNAPILLIIQTVLQIFQLAFELFNYTKFYPMHEVYFYPPKINVCHFHDDTIILCPLFGSKSLNSSNFVKNKNYSRLFRNFLWQKGKSSL